MIVKTHTGAVNLNNFDSLYYCRNLAGYLFSDVCKYTVTAQRTQPDNGILGGKTSVEVDIATYTSDEIAGQLTNAISSAWVRGDSSFDVAKWEEENNVSD